MTPSTWVVAMLLAVSLIYGATALAYSLGSRPGMALAFVGYVIANAGLIWDAISQAKLN